ncbi:MAG: MiaB/RimO family radical SAM methylthiotransferase, partial [Proteobacteria bacterium]|nr:MiaB/RimO family radical SAM methylthiotransferase [Pseudomonadota bacterium]
MQESPKSIYIKTFGCQMNVYDSDRMSGLLAHQGYALEKDIRKADVVLINTCSIRDKSEHKVLSLLGELKALKKTNPGKVLGITGCVGQRMGRTLLQKAPHLDIVMGPDAIDRVGNLVGTVLKKGERVLDVQFDADRKRTYSQPSIVYRAKPVEFLTIMKGCDHFCTYCIVPFTRGREKSRPIAEVIHDVKKFVAQGTKEITFLGQNINTYGKGTPENLSQLVEEADRVEGLERIRYITSHPRDLGEDLIAQFGSISKLCPSLHLPFQAGSDTVLKAMSRLYTRDEYL